MKKKETTFPTGQTLVEFALILPLFVLMVMFIFDIGRGVYYYSVVYNAVREGARFATVGDPNIGAAGIKDRVVQRAYGMNLTPDRVTVTWSGTTAPVIVTVHVDYDYYPITPLISAFLTNNRLELRIETKMRLEYY